MAAPDKNNVSTDMDTRKRAAVIFGASVPILAALIATLCNLPRVTEDLTIPLDDRFSVYAYLFPVLLALCINVQFAIPTLLLGYLSGPMLARHGRWYVCLIPGLAGPPVVWWSPTFGILPEGMFNLSWIAAVSSFGGVVLAAGLFQYWCCRKMQASHDNAVSAGDRAGAE